MDQELSLVVRSTVQFRKEKKGKVIGRSLISLPLSTMPEPNEEIMTYIRQNKDKYTREAIDQHLRKAGWEQTDINLAWQRLEEAPYQRQSRDFFLAFLFGGIVTILATWFVVDLAVAQATFYNRLFQLGIFYTLIIIFILLLLGTAPPINGYLLQRGWTWRRILTTIGILYFVWFAIIIGYCVSVPKLLFGS